MELLYTLLKKMMYADNHDIMLVVLSNFCDFFKENRE